MERCEQRRYLREYVGSMNNICLTVWHQLVIYVKGIQIRYKEYKLKGLIAEQT